VTVEKTGRMLLMILLRCSLPSDLKTSGARSDVTVAGPRQQSIAMSVVESLWNNNHDFCVLSVITTDLEPYHISIGCGFFQLKRLGIRCAILVFYEE
jgi:hypothetical protein